MSTFVLFVYGTLKRGGIRHGTIARARYLGAARTRAGYALYDLGHYPGMVREDDGGRVEGELYEVSSALVPVLDAVEGAPSLFRLAEVEVEGQDRPARSYLFAGDVTGRPKVESGRWDNAPPPLEG